MIKQLKTTLLIFAALTLAFSSCKKDSSSPQNSSPSISLTVDGTAKSSPNVVASYYQSEKTLQVTGQLGATESVSFMVQNIKAGAFDLSTDAALGTYSTSADMTNTYIANSGTLTITSFTDTSVSGTFQFTATNTANAAKTISEGKFTAKIIKI